VHHLVEKTHNNAQQFRAIISRLTSEIDYTIITYTTSLWQDKCNVFVIQITAGKTSVYYYFVRNAGRNENIARRSSLTGVCSTGRGSRLCGRIERYHNVGTSRILRTVSCVLSSKTVVLVGSRIWPKRTYVWETATALSNRRAARAYKRMEIANANDRSLVRSQKRVLSLDSFHVDCASTILRKVFWYPPTTQQLISLTEKRGRTVK